MKQVFLYITLVLSIGILSAQTGESDMFIQEDDLNTSSILKKEKKDKKIRTEVLVGSSFSTMGSNNFALNTFVEPRITYQMTPRFEVSMGLMAVQSNLNNFTYYNYEGQTQSVDYNGLSAYYTLQGAYLLTEKLKVFGGIMIGTEMMNWTPEANSDNKMNPKAYQIGFEYKLGDDAYIQLMVQYRESNYVQMQQDRFRPEFMYGNTPHRMNTFSGIPTPRFW